MHGGDKTVLERDKKKYMKLIDQKIIEQRTGCLTDPSTFYKEGMLEGIEFAESILLPKMIEFVEWLRSEGRVPDAIQFGSKVEYGWSVEWEDNKCVTQWEDFKTTAQLLDIWIEQTRTVKP
jgi:hypothetical protein